MSALAPPIRYAMVGGGRDSFIGSVHRHAMALDGRYRLVAGALSSTPDKALASSRDLGLPDARSHGDWRSLLAAEAALPPAERAEAVVVVTPNDLHYPVVKAALEAGFHVVCDKPIVHTGEQAAELVALAQRSGCVAAVTYNYTGYPMVKQARHMVGSGVLGEIRKVTVEYNQGWLSQSIEASNKQAAWRGDPRRAGLGGAIADIGTHAENLVSTVTGLHVEALCADLSAFVAGRRVDDDASVLLRFAGGARGVLAASQVCAGIENGLRLRVSGTRGSIEWAQEHPSELHHFPLDGPRQLLTRGSPWLCDEARAASRLPAGHPEGFIEAFANLYGEVAGAIRGGRGADFPGFADGARGVAFVEAVIASSRSAQKWTTLAGSVSSPQR